MANSSTPRQRVIDMFDNYWRMTAKHTTVCPRCRKIIEIGDTIVKEETHARWSHAVCPGMASRRQKMINEAPSCEEYVMTIVDGKVVQTKVS